MKKISILLVLAIAVSCSKKEDIVPHDEKPVPMHFSAQIEMPESDTKTLLSGTPSDANRRTVWLPEDSIYVTNGKSNAKFVNISKDTSEIAEFEGVLAEGTSYYAAYPYGMVQNYASSTFTFILPSSQTYYEDGVNSDSFPMVAQCSSGVFNFKNICGLLVLRLQSTKTVTISSVSFSGKDADGNSILVSGKGTVPMTYSDVPTLTMDESAADTSITLNCPDGVTVETSIPKTFHLIVPAATYSTFSLLITNSEGLVTTVNATKPLTVKRSRRVTTAPLNMGKFVPTVHTADISDTAFFSAKCGGNIPSDGGSKVLSRGVVWSKSENPTIDLPTKTVDSSGVGTYVSNLSNLELNTKYYVRAYAVNTNGVMYGQQKSFITLGADIKDLSADGTANCYIVSSSGCYKFKGTVKGETGELLENPQNAQTLWESFGTDVQPSIGDIVRGVSYLDDYVFFATPRVMNNGNAVIAVKNASDIVLWSWHIWLSEDFDPLLSGQVYNNSAGTVMDRNLGATSATPGDVQALGLLYQWGRKDPFIGSSSISDTSKAKSTGIWLPNVSSTSSTGTFDYVEKHPMQFVTGNSQNYDWYFTGSSSTDNTRWLRLDTAKGKYDPCPYGWRVPEGRLWLNASGSSSFSSPWDETNRGVNFGTSAGVGKSFAQYPTVWYPSSGMYNFDDGSLGYVGNYGKYWSCSQYSGLEGSPDRAVILWVAGNDFVETHSYGLRACGMSVRCISDKYSIPVVSTASVSSVTESTAVCGGNITSDGGLSVSAKGVVWSNSQNPTVESCTGKTNDGVGSGIFSSYLTGLSSYTSYYVRSYATNTLGTAYGKEIQFVTDYSGSAVDLSEAGTSNCYIISKAGKYKFKATVKGSSTESVGIPSIVEVLWESFGTWVKTSVGDIISNPSYSDGYVTFVTNPAFNNGNAVIAVKDVSGTILWSWHIWVCKDFDPLTTAQEYNNNAGTMMDRNLGATSVTPGDVNARGLLYQWGRKDPFLSVEDYYSSLYPWPEAVRAQDNSSDYEMNLKTSIRNPTTFIQHADEESSSDWFCINNKYRNDELWHDTRYNPCPYGWRVPNGGSNGLWRTASSGKSNPSYKTDVKGIYGDENSFFVSTDTCWYPGAGRRNMEGGNLGSVGDGNYWSSSPYVGAASYSFHFDKSTLNTESNYYRANAQSVRCIKEN